MESLPESPSGFVPPELVTAAVRSLPLTVEDLMSYGVPLADLVDRAVTVLDETPSGRAVERDGWIVSVIPPKGRWQNAIAGPWGAVEVQFYGLTAHESFCARECWPVDQAWARGAVDRLLAELVP